jgi:hypothetical protein
MPAACAGRRHRASAHRKACSCTSFEFSGTQPSKSDTPSTHSSPALATNHERVQDQEIADMTKVEAAAKAIHDQWKNGTQSWEDTKSKLPAQADDFIRKALAAIYAIVPDEDTENCEIIKEYFRDIFAARHLELK